MAGMLEESLSSVWLRPAVLSRHSRPTHCADALIGARRCVRRCVRPNVIDQELFADALLRERRRAERFNQPFVLLLLSIRNGVSAEPTSTWAAVVDSVAAVSRPTDVLGWLEQGSVIGLILPHVDAFDAAVTRELEAKVRLALSARMDVATIARCSIRLLVHCGASTTCTQADFGADPFERIVCRHKVRPIVRAATKRGLDIIGSLALLVLLSPVFLIVAALVKLTSSGPVIFRQARVGRSARPFTMLKFRTMRMHADDAIHQQYVTQFIKASHQLSGSFGAVFKIVNDPRLTPIGHFLRRTSLDELPQFWNVLRGDMSLVGPRPPLPYEVKQYKPWHRRRVLEAKPGVTGLWQVTGRSRTTFEDMVRLDLRYARTCSVWNDIKILLATPRAVLTGKGAC